MSRPNYLHGDSTPVAAARAAVVNRTHRVVRERAQQMQRQRRSRRELVLPLLICSAVLAVVCYAAWVVASGTGFGAVGTELQQEAGKLLTGQTIDTGSPVFLLLLWFLPISVVTVGALYLRRGRRTGREQLNKSFTDPFADEVRR